MNEFSNSNSDPQKLITSARQLFNPDPNTAGIWPRSAALLTRQALEGAMAELWSRRAPGVEQCSMRAQLLALRQYLRVGNLARRVAYAWTGLSRATHHHSYELPPTAAELQHWMDTVAELVEAVESVPR